MILFVFTSIAIWIRVLMHKGVMRDSHPSNVHGSHPFLKKIKLSALRFHLTVLILLWASSVCGVSASFARAFAFQLPYGWRLCYGIEFVAQMLFFNAALRIAFFWSSLATKTFKKDWYRRWSSRVCNFFSFSLLATVNGSALGLLFFFVLPLVKVERHAFSFAVAIFTCILSFVMSLSFILYGLVLLKYFHGKKVRKLLRLSLLTLLTTTSFFVMCLMNLLNLLIIHTRASNPQLQEAGPFVYLFNNALCHVLVAMILCWFFGCAAAPGKVAGNLSRKGSKVLNAAQQAQKSKPKLTVNTVSLRVPGGELQSCVLEDDASLSCTSSVATHSGLTPLKPFACGSDFSGMSISSGNTLMSSSGSGHDSPFPSSLHHFSFSVLHEMAASDGGCRNDVKITSGTSTDEASPGHSPTHESDTQDEDMNIFPPCVVPSNHV